MTKIRKVLPYIIIISLIISNVYLFQKVNHLQIKVEEKNNKIAFISSKVEDLKKQVSIFESMEVEIGELNTVSLMIPIHIKVTPKILSDGITAELILKDKTVSMAQKGTTFELNTEISVFEEFQYDEVKIIITDGENKATESVDNNDIYNMRYKFLLRVNAWFVGNSTYSTGQYYINGKGYINIENINDNDAKYIQYVRELNGNILEEKFIDQQKLNRTMKIKIKDSYNLNPKDNLIDCFLITDQYGIVYKYVVNSLEIDAKGECSHILGEERSLTEIYNKEGKLMWEGEFY